MSDISLSQMGEDSTKLKKLFFYSKCLCIVGFSLTLTAVGSYFFADYMLKDQLYKNILIENNSKAYQFWKEPPAKIFRKYYLFDLVNPIEVEQGTAKPHVIQHGPYTFSEKWEKRNVQFYGLQFFSFKPVVTLYFEPTLSNGSLNDPITFLNIPAVGMIETLMHGKSNVLTIAAANALFKVLKIKLFVTKTAGELISGYEDPLMEIAKVLLPNIIKENKFSLINGKNGTEWQNYTLNTGKDDIQSVARIKLWDGLDKLSYWDSVTANMINGSDGTFYPPFRTRTQNLYAYSPDMCRSYNLVYLRDNVVKDIKTYDFHLDKMVFYNSTLNPNNYGFCGRDDVCLGNGVQNISTCYGGVSGFISQPHFLNADAKFTEQVHGLKPDENIHDFILSFEPTSGVPITGNIRLQISFYMFHNNDIDLVKNVKSNLIPVVWFDEQLDLYEDTRKQLGQVAMIAQLCFVVPMVLLCFGAFWILFSVSLFLVFKHKKKYIVEKERSGYESKEESSDEPTEATRLLSDNQEKVIN